MKRKFNEEKERLEVLNKDFKSQLDTSAIKYNTQIETLRSELEKQR